MTARAALGPFGASFAPIPVPVATWEAGPGEAIGYAALQANPRRELAGLRDILICQYGGNPDYLVERERRASRRSAAGASARRRS